MAITKTYYDTLTQASSADDSALIVIQTQSNSSLATMQKINLGLVRQPTNDKIASNANSILAENSRALSSEASLAASVTAENSRALSSEASLAASVTAENSRALSSEASLAASVTAERNRAQSAESSLSSALSSSIDSLNASEVGDDGYYIKKISESSGVIIAESEALETDVNNNSNKAPSASAVKAFVENNINDLDVDVVGDDTSSNPTTVITSIREEDGKIIATVAPVADSISNDPNSVPTTQAVYNMEQSAILAALSALDYNSGRSDSYIKTIKQEDGQVEVTIQKFDTYDKNNEVWSSSVSNINVPTTQAVEDRVMIEAASRASAVEALDYQSSGANGSFVQKVDQTDGKIQETVVAFFNDDIATVVPGGWEYSSNTSVAPTVRSVAREIARLDVAASTISSGVTSINVPLAGKKGEFIQSIEQEAGYIKPTAASFVSSIAASTTVNDNNVAPTEHAVRQAINALDYVSSGAAGSYVQKVKEDDGIIEETIIKFDTYDPSSEAWSSTPTDNNVPSTLAVKKVVDQEAASRASAIKALDFNELGENGYYIKTVKQEDGKLGATKQKFDTYENRAWVTGPSDNNAPTSQAIENRIEEAKRQIIQETEAMVYLGAVESLADLKDKAEHSGREYHYLEGDTYIANGEFNLDESGTPDPAYEVNIGDFIIVKFGVFSNDYDKDDFDIVGGSKRAIMFTGSSATPGNFLMFSNDSGINAVDSGENSTTLNAKVEAAGLSASCAASSALCASSSASYAWGMAIPFRDDAASAASYAQGSSKAAYTAMTGAQQSSNSAKSAMTGAQDSSRSAYTAMTGAQNSSTAAYAAMTGAQQSSNSAKSAMTGAQNSSTAAYAAMTGAQNSSTAAYAAMTGAQQSSNSAKSAMTGAQSALSLTNEYKASAQSAMTGAQNSSTAAYAAMTGAQNSSSSAKSAMIIAQDSSTAAYAAMTGAQQSSNSAKSAMTGAQNSSTAAYAAMTGAQQSSNSAKSAMTGAQNSSTSASYAASSALVSMTKAASYSTAANLEGIKTAAQQAASRAASEAASAASSATSAASAAASAASSATYITTGFIDKTTTTTQAMKATLQVLSGSTVKAYVTNTGAASFADEVSANSFNANSSRKLKENVNPTVVSALDLIEKVKVVDFNYINDDEKTPHIGFIAEDTDSLLSTPHQNKMDYTNCIGTLLKAVQEITKGMKELRDEVERIKQN